MTPPRMADLLPQAPGPGPTHWHARIGRQKTRFRCALQALHESPRHRRHAPLRDSWPHVGCTQQPHNQTSPLQRYRGRRVLFPPPPRGRKNIGAPIGTRSCGEIIAVSTKRTGKDLFDLPGNGKYAFISRDNTSSATGLAYPISTEERTASTAACASAPLHEKSRATKAHAPRLPATTKLLAIPGSAAFTTAHSPLASTYGTRLPTLCSVYVWYKRTMYIVICLDHHHQPVHRPLP